MAQEHVKTADELELELITLLKHPPIALTISKRDVDRYAWHWLGASGEGDSFPNALENALAHIATTYLAFITPPGTTEPGGKRASRGIVRRTVRHRRSPRAYNPAPEEALIPTDAQACPSWVAGAAQRRERL